MKRTYDDRLGETDWLLTSTVIFENNFEANPTSMLKFLSIVKVPWILILFFRIKRFGSFSKMNSRTSSLLVLGYVRLTVLKSMIADILKKELNETYVKTFINRESFLYSLDEKKD